VADHQDIFTAKDAREIGESIGIDWDASPFDVEQFREGLHVELEHGLRDPETNVTDDDRIVTGKIARAHLNEFPTTTRVWRRWRPKQGNTGAQGSQRGLPRVALAPEHA
jgi:Protein of unknown function (DUF5661)